MARARKFCDVEHGAGRGTWQQILEEEVLEAYACASDVELRAELVQVAAVAVAWIEAIDRRNTHDKPTRYCQACNGRGTRIVVERTPARELSDGRTINEGHCIRAITCECAGG